MPFLYFNKGLWNRYALGAVIWPCTLPLPYDASLVFHFSFHQDKDDASQSWTHSPMICSFTVVLILCWKLCIICDCQYISMFTIYLLLRSNWLFILSYMGVLFANMWPTAEYFIWFCEANPFWLNSLFLYLMLGCWAVFVIVLLLFTLWLVKLLYYGIWLRNFQAK